jgi:hypothetical protein
MNIMNNAFFQPNSAGKSRMTDLGAKGTNVGLGLMNPYLSTGYRDDDAWASGGNVGATGFSSVSEGVGQLAGQFGPVGVGIQAGLQGVGALTDLFAYNPEVDALRNTYSSDQLPSFDLSEEASSQANFMGEFNKSANKKIGSAALGGAATGAAFGGPVGAAIGGAVGAIGGLIGKGKAKKEAKEAAQEMKSQYSEGIQRFNASSKQYYNRQTAMDQYRSRQQSQRGLFNVPSSNPYFYLG